MKGKGEREEYTQMNAEFQRIPRRDNKSFLDERCKGIEENNKMGKTRDLFKKPGDIKGKFHARMGTIKDRNSNDLPETEEIKKRWQEYTEELYKKGPNDPDCRNHVLLLSKKCLLEFNLTHSLFLASSLLPLS